MGRASAIGLEAGHLLRRIASVPLCGVRSATAELFLRLLGRETPVIVDVQFSRNVGAPGPGTPGKLRASSDGCTDSAISAPCISTPSSTPTPSSRNSRMTTWAAGRGSNVPVHAVRLDAGLARFLQIQNLFFFQNQRLPSDPGNGSFVPLPQHANMTFRYQGQVLFVF